MGTKDFAPIESDYAFFMQHATEAEHDLKQYVAELDGFPQGRAAVRLLDFGCGTGEFSEQLLAALDWPPETVHLTLVEPVEHQRKAAIERLSRFSRAAIDQASRLALLHEPRFDLIVANHVLYYVEDLQQTLQTFCAALQPGGRMQLVIAGWDNVLLQLWQVGFELLGRPVPYYAAEDVAAVLSASGIPTRRTPVAYQLKFPDSAENRLKILRFLFGEHLPHLPTPQMLREFDRYAVADQIVIHTASDHFVVEGTAITAAGR